MREDENACNMCSECKCLSCKKREMGIGHDDKASECGRCDNGCENIPMDECSNYEHSDE